MGEPLKRRWGDALELLPLPPSSGLVVSVQGPIWACDMVELPRPCEWPPQGPLQQEDPHWLSR